MAATSKTSAGEPSCRSPSDIRAVARLSETAASTTVGSGKETIVLTTAGFASTVAARGPSVRGDLMGRLVKQALTTGNV